MLDQERTATTTGFIGELVDQAALLALVSHQSSSSLALFRS